MNIGIVTFYQVHNHGALLQMYAMNKIFLNLNLQTFVIQFLRDYRFVENESKYEVSLKSIPIYFSLLKERGIKNIYYNYSKRKCLQKFSKNYFQFLSPHELLDYYCVGSDEIFSTEIGFNAISYGLEGKFSSIFSYAGSFGPTNYNNILEQGLTENIKKGLSSFKGLSVRDDNSKEIVEKITNKKVDKNIDPVLLYGFKEEISKNKRILDYEYLLVYSYDKNFNSKKEVESIKRIAKEKNLKIVSPGFYHSWCDINLNLNPLDLLLVFRDASFVITDTFHGSVISIISHQKFFSLVRGNANKLESLLKEFDLEDRIISSLSNIDEKLANTIDYNHVDEILNDKRIQSIKYLKSMIK